MLSGMSDLHAQELGKRGGKARALALSQDQRSDIARLGAAERWKGHIPKYKPRKTKKTS